MAVSRFLARTLLVPLFERLRGRSTLRHLAIMRANDRLDALALERRHRQMLLEHLRRAAETVPYYRERVQSETIRGPDDLRRFPLLDKAAIRAAGRSLVSDLWREKVFQLETGGSSGEPLHFFTDKNRESSQLACKLRARHWWGLAPGLRETDFWGSPIELRKEDRLRSLANRMFGFQLLSAFDLNPETMAAFRRRMEGGRTDLIYGYPSVLARYARFLKERGEDLKGLPLRLAITTAETLLPADRELIQQVFGVPVANEYGCRDGGLIAHESPHGFHLMHDAVHVEVLGPDLEPLPPGELGEVAVTNLHARGCPLIRYRLGDLIRLDPEPPGGPVPHPRVLELLGRITDSLVKDDGSRVHGLALIYILRELPGVASFRCIQEQPGQLTIELVPGTGFDPQSIQTGIVTRAQRVLGAGTEVEVQPKTHLQPGPGGKHHYIICRVKESNLA